MIWWALYAATAVALALSFGKGQNPVWGGATMGALVGVAIAFFRPGFDWGTVAHSLAIGALSGAMIELLGWLTNRLKRGL